MRVEFSTDDQYEWTYRWYTSAYAPEDRMTSSDVEKYAECLLVLLDKFAITEAT